MSFSALVAVKGTATAVRSSPSATRWYDEGAHPAPFAHDATNHQ